VNDKFLKITEYERSEMIGKKLSLIPARAMGKLRDW
jgi:hypothetical protein